MVHALYVLESITRFHSYCLGMREAFETAEFNAAFSKDRWSLDFNEDEDDGVDALRLTISSLQSILGATGAVAGYAGTGTSAAFGGFNALSAGVNNAVTQVIDSETKGEEPKLEKAADFGARLGRMSQEVPKIYIDMNNVLMRGDNFRDSGDIRDYFKEGFFVHFKGVDEIAVIDAVNVLTTSYAINSIWRSNQRIYIMGGGKCGDNQGIGTGPQDGCWCDEKDNTAWYIYYWHPGDDDNFVGDVLYGWVEAPQGRFLLGKDNYARIDVTEVIRSSVRSYRAAGHSNDYNPTMAKDRAMDALREDGKPTFGRPDQEGVFTLPVCDISKAANAPNQDTYFGRDRILKPWWPGELFGKKMSTPPSASYSVHVGAPPSHNYLEEHQPWYCGPICDGDYDKSRRFFEAAHMHNYDSYHFRCEHHSEETSVFPNTLSGWSPESSEEKAAQDDKD